jgi:outer membrane protein OmpA-like peptidoglycan-associated protein
MSKLRTLAAATGAVALAAALGCATRRPIDAGAKPDAATGALAGAPDGAAGAAVAAGPSGSYLDKQARELGAIPGADVARREDALIVNLEAGSLFDASSATLSPGGSDRVRALARTLQSYPQERVIVKGHTDSQGDERFNQRLSEDRADSVRNLLVAEGVTPSRITAVGLGAGLPIATNATAEGREQNRRLEIELRPDTEVLQGESAQ